IISGSLRCPNLPVSLETRLWWLAPSRSPYCWTARLGLLLTVARMSLLVRPFPQLSGTRLSLTMDLSLRTELPLQDALLQRRELARAGPLNFPLLKPATTGLPKRSLSP